LIEDTPNESDAGNHSILITVLDGDGIDTNSFNYVIYDLTNPSVVINSPLEGYSYNSTSVVLNTSVSDGKEVDSCWYSLDNWTTKTSYDCVNATLNCSVGPATVWVGASDSSGNLNNTGSVNFTAYIADCDADSDCGVDGYVGGTYCHDHDVYRMYRTYTCSDAVTATSSCSHSNADSLITNCGVSYIVYGSNYCSLNNAVRDATLITRDCDSSTVSCYSEIGGVDTEVVEECGVNYTCVNGSCVGDGGTTTTTTSSTTTSTTTTSSTTTTLPWPCELPGDYPPCGEVILAEVMDYLILWPNGGASLSDVVALVNVWVEGYSSTTTTTVTSFSTSTVTLTSSSTLTISTTTSTTVRGKPPYAWAAS
jgi:hypothetical protein